MRRHQHAVLLVDDDGETRAAVRARLEEIGMEVVCARHGRAALQLLSLGIAPCAMLVDVVKPQVAGAELRRALQYDAALRVIPVIAITVGDPVDFDHLRAAADDYCPYQSGLRRHAVLRRLGPELARPPSGRGSGRRFRAAAFESSH